MNPKTRKSLGAALAWVGLVVALGGAGVAFGWFWVTANPWRWVIVISYILVFGPPILILTRVIPTRLRVGLTTIACGLGGLGLTLSVTTKGGPPLAQIAYWIIRAFAFFIFAMAGYRFAQPSTTSQRGNHQG